MEELPETKISVKTLQSAAFVMLGIVPTSLVGDDDLPASAVDDQKYLKILRGAHCQMPQAASAMLNKHPRNLGRCFIVRCDCDMLRQKQHKTTHGCWRKKGSKAIRGDAVSGNPPNSNRGGLESPHYIGMKTICGFRQGKTKTDWAMVQYTLLNDSSILDSDRALIKVVDRKGKGPTTCGDAATTLAPLHPTTSTYCPTTPLPSIESPGDNFASIFGANGYGNEDDVDLTKKRSSNTKRRSEVWENLTDICTEKGQLVFAACHFCDTVLHASYGTSTPTKHLRNCKHKHPPSKDMPMQQQSNGN